MKATTKIKIQILLNTECHAQNIDKYISMWKSKN